MGWMPTAIDLSSWNSLWTLEKIKNTNYHPTLKETLFEFNLGYLISAFLSICFMTMGAFLIYGTKTTIALSKSLICKSSSKSVHQSFWRLELYNNCIKYIFNNVWNLYSCI